MRTLLDGMGATKLTAVRQHPVTADRSDHVTILLPDDGEISCGA
jgi:hypothetical protein